MSDTELSVIVPVFNNSESLPELIDRINAACLEVCKQDFEIILVDDGSHDDSWGLISSSPFATVRGLKLSRNFGQHAALKAGFAEAQGRYIVMMDADLEERPELISDLMAKLAEGFDVCFTAYPVESKSHGRRTSRIFHRAVRLLSDRDHSPNIMTMRGFNRKVLDAILRHGERRPVYGPLIVGLGFSSTTILVEMPAHKGRQSSYSFLKRLRLALDYLIGYTNLPAVFFLAASGLAFVATAIYTAIILFQYFVSGNQLPPGISLLVVLILLLFSTLFFGIGIIGLYLHRLLEESLGRPLYIVAESSYPRASSETDQKFKRLPHVRRD